MAVNAVNTTPFILFLSFSLTLPLIALYISKSYSFILILLILFNDPLYYLLTNYFFTLPPFLEVLFSDFYLGLTASVLTETEVVLGGLEIFFLFLLFDFFY